MNAGDYVWDTPQELRTLCKSSLRLSDGNVLFSAGKKPLAVATLEPDGETLTITIWPERVLEIAQHRAEDQIYRYSE